MIQVLTIMNGKYKVFVYANDHNPPHAHLIGPGGAELVFDLRDLSEMWCNGFKQRAVRVMLQKLEPHQDALMEMWELINDG